MDCKPTDLDRPRPAAFSLVEMLVGVALGGLLLTAVASLYLFSVKSFMCMSNYSELNAKNRHASDTISRDIRGASTVASVSTNKLVLRYGTIDVAYTFDPTNRTLIRSQLGRDLVLLDCIDSIKFSLYQRPASGAAYEDLIVASAPAAKVVGFEWSCSHKIFGAQKNSRALEAAIVKMRNK